MASKRPSLSESMKALAQEAASDSNASIPNINIPPSVAARAEMKKILVPVEPSLHKKLKLLAVEQDKTLESICRVALMDYISRNK